MSIPKLLNLKKAGEFEDFLAGEKESVEGLDYDIEEDEEVEQEREEEE